MAKKTSKLGALPPVGDGVPTLPTVPVRPTPKFGVLPECVRYPFMKNFTKIVKWLFDNRDVVIDTNDYFNGSSCNSLKTGVAASKIVDDVIKAFGIGTRCVLRYGKVDAVVTSVYQDATSGNRAFSAVGTVLDDADAPETNIYSFVFKNNSVTLVTKKVTVS